MRRLIHILYLSLLSGIALPAYAQDPGDSYQDQMVYFLNMQFIGAQATGCHLRGGDYADKVADMTAAQLLAQQIWPGTAAQPVSDTAKAQYTQMDYELMGAGMVGLEPVTVT